MFPEELRIRTRMIVAGVSLSAVLVVAMAGWVAATWHDPHRGGLAVLTALAAICTGVIAVLPHERLVASRWREPFFLLWSLSLIGLIGIASGLDAGVRSPMVLLLFLTLVYAALSYPLRSVAVISVASLLTVAVLSRVGDARGGPTDPVYLAGLMLTLAMAGIMCIWQARLQQQQREELALLSRSDPLTGVLNRLGLAERLTAELGRAKSGGASLALVLLDFDDFKAVNDELGHAAGDELLRWAAAAMTGALRPDDTLGRLGGDEFAALLPGTDTAQGTVVAERLRLALSPRIGASAGVASSPDDGPVADLLHRCADERLYCAKRARAEVA